MGLFSIRRGKLFTNEIDTSLGLLLRIYCMWYVHYYVYDSQELNLNARNTISLNAYICRRPYYM